MSANKKTLGYRSRDAQSRSKNDLFEFCKYFHREGVCVVAAALKTFHRACEWIQPSYGLQTSKNKKIIQAQNNIDWNFYSWYRQALKLTDLSDYNTSSIGDFETGSSRPKWDSLRKLVWSSLKILVESRSRHLSTRKLMRVSVNNRAKVTFVLALVALPV